MPRGYALVVGLDALEPSKWQGWDGKLAGCEKDASAMKAMLTARGFEVKTMLTAEATIENVRAEMNRFSRMAQTGDIFVWTHSGHGTQVPDRGGDEDDGLDEALCLYDGLVVDDRVNRWLAKFQDCVRLVQWFDTCHSESMDRSARAVFRTNPGVLQAKPKAGEICSSICLSSSKSTETSGDLPAGGVGTINLLKHLPSSGSYVQLWERMKKTMPRWQQPTLQWPGYPMEPPEDLLAEIPFSIKS
jgi:hypothetical protein